MEHRLSTKSCAQGGQVSPLVPPFPACKARGAAFSCYYLCVTLGSDLPKPQFRHL